MLWVLIRITSSDIVILMSNHNVCLLWITEEKYHLIIINARLICLSVELCQTVKNDCS